MQIYTPYFIYNGIDSRKMGVRVTAMPPTVRAEKRVETIAIPGRSGSLHIYDNAYENYTKTIECAIKDRQRIDEIAAWLDGSGEIIFSSEPDKVYKVHIINTISITQMMLVFQKFQVNFDTFPFKYSVNAFNDEMKLTEPKIILNKGTIYAEPIITVHGAGQVTIEINGASYGLSNIDGHTIINSEIMEVYKDGQNLNATYQSDSFPRFEVGENALNWTGNVTKIEITPNWRWL